MIACDINLLVFYVFSLLSSCSSFRDSQYGSGNVHVNSNHDLDTIIHTNHASAEDAAFVNG